jgi:hypothetical protein
MKYLFLVKTKNSNKPNIDTGITIASLDLNILFTTINIKSNVEFYDNYKQISNLIELHNPTHIIIEDLFVVPEILFELKTIYPTICWIIRIHTAIMFNGSELFTIDWIAKYLKMTNVKIITNDSRFCDELNIFNSVLDNPNNHIYYDTNKIVYLPNYYHIKELRQHKKIKSDNSDTINICCFGSLRPLKNNLIQAIAAIEFCKKINKKLNFHTNNRVESGGSEYEKNLQRIFSYSNNNYNLISHEWRSRDDFIELCKSMDIGMQVSLSETFNIVAADIVTLGIPLVGSNEIPWLSRNSIANTTNVNDIIDKLLFVYENVETNVLENQKNLLNYIDNSKQMWEKYLFE